MNFLLPSAWIDLLDNIFFLIHCLKIILSLGQGNGIYFYSKNNILRILLTFVD